MAQLQQIKNSALDALAALPPRDRYLAIGLVLITFFGGLGYSVYSMNDSLNAARADIERIERNKELVQILQEEQANLESDGSKES